MIAVVKGNVHAEFRTGIEQASTIGIFADYARGFISSNPILSVRKTRPRFAEIVGAINVRREIAQQVAIQGHVCSPSAVWTRLDILNASAGRKAPGSHVGPSFRVIARHVHESVVRTGPDHTFLYRRLANRIERAVNFFASRIACDGLPARTLALRRMRREIGGDALPSHAAVVRAMQ